MHIVVVDTDSKREMWTQLGVETQLVITLWPAVEFNRCDIVLLHWDAVEYRDQFLQEIAKQNRAIPILVLSKCLDALVRTSEFVDYLPYPLTVEQLKASADSWRTCQIIDKVYWERLKTFDGEGKLLKEIIEALPRTGEKYIQALGEAIEAFDCVAVARHAHGLKSSVSYIGAKRLISVCRQIENYSSTTSKEALKRNFLFIKQEFVKLQLRLQDLARNET